MSESEQADAIAVIGMEGRFPTAPSVADFWTMLAEGREAIRPVSAEDYLRAGGTPSGLADPHLVRVESVLDDIDLFDAEFFRFQPAEAELLDPQQRVFMECAYQALEQAGYEPTGYDGAIGVYAGSSQSTYYLDHVYPLAARRHGTVDAYVASVANASSALVSRVSYLLNLTGPSVSVQTACSTSLVAIHQACQDLLEFRCDMALAGGASVNPSARLGYRHVPGGPFSPDGHCRPYSADAAGMSPGDGVGVVVLKRLSEALADGDHVRAVIRGSAVNNDGSRKVGFTAPSVKGQRDAIVAAQTLAGVSPREIGYVEGHGTATPVGDPIEVSALTKAFSFGTSDTGFCALGSVKSNIGHLDAAAGVASFIKAVLALENGLIPATLHFSRPNELIDFERSPFYVAGQAIPWGRSPTPRYAGVSSFGVGGTNAHLVLSEAPAPVPVESDDTSSVVVLSASTARALDQMRERLADRISTESDARVSDIAATLQEGRRALPVRQAVVVDSTATLVESLRADAGHRGRADDAEVVFLFPGAGSQYRRMAQGLYQAHSVFRQELDRCARIIDRAFGEDLLDALYPPGSDTDRGNVDLPSCGYPAIVAVEWALTRLLASWGIRPDALIGHSLGEYTAACVAGVLTLDDALPLVRERERLIRKAGGMTLSVRLAAADAEEYLVDGVSLSGINGPGLCTLSGTADAILELERTLAARGVDHHRLRVPGAVHSVVLDSVLDEFRDVLAGVTLRPPQLPVVSNLTGDWLTTQQAVDREYWVGHTRRTVRFADGLRTVAARGPVLLLEAGPSGGLAKLADQTLGAGTRTAQAIRHAYAEQPDTAVLNGAVAWLWANGTDVNWAAVRGGERFRRVPLPGYPFQRRRFWVPRADIASGAVNSGTLTAPVWTGSGVEEPVPDRSGLPGTVVVVLNGDAKPDVVPDGLVEAVDRLLLVGIGEDGPDEHGVHRVSPERARELGGELAEQINQGPVGVLDLSALGVNDPVDALNGAVASADLVAGIAEAASELPIRVVVATCGAVALPGGDRKLWGRAWHGVVAHQGGGDPRLRASAVDFDEVTAAGLVSALADPGPEPDRLVAWRGGRRWAGATTNVTSTRAGADNLPARWAVVVDEHGSAGGVDLVLADALGLRNIEPVTFGRVASTTDLEGDALGLLWVLDHTTPDTWATSLVDLWRSDARTPVLVVDVVHGEPAPRQAIVSSLTAAVVESAAAAGLPWKMVRWEQSEGAPPAVETFRAALRVAGRPVLTMKAAGLSPEPGSEVSSDEGGVDSGRKRPPLSTPYTAPRTDVERRVAEIWHKVLGVEGVGADDNFFELGGESLLLMQIVSELRDHFVVTMSIRQLYVHDRLTVAGIAAILEEKTP
ncbi:type I polyketide synthase [Saccharothrix saharensis]|uniref:type I polyketide synthase n=1 Tax=Saccharothrix saharensis TaxID=571190 RepID=UPI00367675D5